MKKIPTISDSEYIVMKVIWEENPITANQIIAKLKDETDWHPKTIRTLLNRLVKKEIINFTTIDNLYHYSPLIPKKKYLKLENKSFLKRVYDGALNVMFANFLEEEKLTKEEIKELQEILNQNKNS